MSDKNVEAVREKMRLRAEFGLKKYSVTTERGDLSRKQWLIHAQEEAMDLAVYLERLINEETSSPEEDESAFELWAKDIPLDERADYAYQGWRAALEYARKEQP